MQCFAYAEVWVQGRETCIIGNKTTTPLRRQHFCLGHALGQDTERRRVSKGFAEDKERVGDQQGDERGQQDHPLWSQHHDLPSSILGWTNEDVQKGGSLAPQPHTWPALRLHSLEDNESRRCVKGRAAPHALTPSSLEKRTYECDTAS